MLSEHVRIWYGVGGFFTTGVQLLLLNFQKQQTLHTGGLLRGGFVRHLATCAKTLGRLLKAQNGAEIQHFFLLLCILFQCFQKQTC